MGQKVNPHGMRVGVIKDWDSRWYARDEKVGDLIVEDYKIRQYLKKTLYSAGIPNIEIERDSAKVRIYIHCSRPGVVIGKGGAEIERIRLNVEKMIGKPVALSIVEVRTPDTNAQLVAENIAAQLEKRIGFRRAMKRNGAMLAKGRLLGVQFAAAMAHDLWLELGRHADAQAQRIAAALSDRGIAMYVPSPTNQIFPILSDAQIARLQEQVAFNTTARVDAAHQAVRFVTSWATTDAQVDALLAVLAQVLE